jgi:hypothetical protein
MRTRTPIKVIPGTQMSHDEFRPGPGQLSAVALVVAYRVLNSDYPAGIRPLRGSAGTSPDQHVWRQMVDAIVRAAEDMTSSAGRRAFGFQFTPRFRHPLTWRREGEGEDEGGLSLCEQLYRTSPPARVHRVNPAVVRTPRRAHLRQGPTAAGDVRRRPVLRIFQWCPTAAGRQGQAEDRAGMAADVWRRVFLHAAVCQFYNR